MQKKLPDFFSLVFVLIVALLGDVVRAADEPAVKTVSPQKITLRRTSSQPATVRAWHEAELFAKVAGYASKVTADIGDVVKAGQTLMQIDVPEMTKIYEVLDFVVSPCLQSVEKHRSIFRKSILCICIHIIGFLGFP